MKNIINNIKENYKLVLAVLVTGLFLGWLLFHSGENAMVNEESIKGHEGHNHESEDPTTWTCSMHPQIKQDKPGDCPICGMELIPLSSMSSEGNDMDPNEIMMTGSAAKLADIQTIIVSKGIPEKSVYLQGKVHADERKIAELTARFGGRIEKLFVNFTGQNVKKGEKLATIYSPGLLTAQRELIEAISFKKSRPSLYVAAKAKLKLWDLTDEQITAIEGKGEPMVYFDVLSPISGTVMMRHVSVGDYVKEGSPLFKVTDLTKVWVMFDAYESDLPWIKIGDEVNFMVQALPGKSFNSKVSYIDPFLNGTTRVAKVRVELSNPNLNLKPEMFVKGSVQSVIAENSNEILIPKSSVLWTGKRSVVYVKVPDRENPSFLYREIVLGPEAGNFYVVEEGLHEGEEIAVNGVFKIDAAAQLQGLQSMMNPGDGLVSNGDDQSEMEIPKQQENISPDFKVQLTYVYKAYLKMKDAFVASDANKVSNAAKSLNKSIMAVDMELLKGSSHILWMKQLKTMKQSVNAISKLSDIEKQRTEFVNFNLAFYRSLKVFGLKDVKTYYQYCPMANDNKGAYWFSNSEEIRNPYFGDMMLECGEVKEILE